MTKGKKILFFSAILLFLLYIVFAVQPIPPETVLVNKWLKNLETEEDEAGETSPGDKNAVLFSLGSTFGYAGASGELIFSKTTNQYVSISPEYWSEYSPAPEEIIIHKTGQEETITISPAQGYPVFLDRRIFIIGKDQSSITALDENGGVLWEWDFEAPITSMDAAGGYVLAGTLDGFVELLNPDGKAVFPSYTPASRIPVICGCRISSDGSKIALVAGVDPQRFLFLERYGEKDYRVTFHEFLKGEGFRREVHLAFINNDQSVVFESEEGLGIFDVQSRTRRMLPIEGEIGGRIEAFDGSGEDGLFFFVISKGRAADNKKQLTAINLPGKVLLSAPFTSENVFISRRGKELFVGGGSTLASFALDKM